MRQIAPPITPIACIHRLMMFSRADCVSPFLSNLAEDGAREFAKQVVPARIRGILSAGVRAHRAIAG